MVSCRTYRGRGQGFTLVEMLVVMAILTILAAMLLPVLWQARNRARDTTCLSNLQQVGRATLLYAQDYDGYFPYSPWGPNAISVFSAPPDPSDPVITRYGKELQARQGEPGSVPLRPSSATYVRLLLGLTHYAPSDAVFRCPNDSGAPSYGYGKDQTVYSRALSSYLWSPGSAPAAGEEGMGTEEVNGRQEDMLADTSATRVWQDYGSDWHKVLRASSPSTGARLMVRVNAFFADNHVQSVDVPAPAGSSATLLSAKRTQ